MIAQRDALFKSVRVDVVADTVLDLAAVDDEVAIGEDVVYSKNRLCRTMIWV